MALELPSWVVIAFNYAGLPWPGLDEDELRAWAASVRRFAGDVTGNSARTRAVAAGLADSQRSSFTASMAARWEHHDRLIADLHEPLNVFADALDVAADVVVAQKMVVIGAAIAFATEFAATQVGAIFTLGADEAALPEEIISTRAIVDFAIEELKGALIGELLNVSVAQVNDHISRLTGNLLTGGLQVVVEYQSLRLSYGYLRDAASQMRGQAAQTAETGDSAYAENANRDLEDPGEGGAIDSGWASVVQAVKQALLDLALDMFKSLPQTIMRAQEDSAAEIEGAAARAEAADSAAGRTAPHDSGRGPSAEAGTGAALAGAGIVQSRSGLEEIHAVETRDTATGTASSTADSNQARRTTVERVAGECGLVSEEQLAALRDAYNVAHDYQGALIVRTARDMLPDLRADVEEHPDTRIVFVGRDGLSLAAAVHALDPGFYAAHCSEIVLSRALVETAVQDLELRSGASFPQIEGFRQAAGKVDPADTVGAYQQLTEYLRRNGIAAGLPGSHATLVDTSYKGTVQELLSAAYPDTSVKGRYLFFAASPDDPHPGSKFGYALHLEGGAANGGLPVEELPADPELTFSHKDAIGAIEETLHGAGGSPKRMTEGLPEQPPAEQGLAGFNPQVVSPRYADAAVRDGVMRVSLGAVADLAAQVADPHSTAGAALDERANGFRGQLRTWIAGGAADPQLGEYLDSFVRRSDKRVAAQLADSISLARLDSSQAAQVWGSFARCGTLAQKEAFAARFAERVTGGRNDG